MTDRVRRPGVMVVMTDIAAEEEARFNHWYDTEHVPERVGIPGVRRARRFVRYDDAPQPESGTVAATRGPKYLVIYELDDLEVLHGDWAELTKRHSELSRAMYPHMTNLVRETFELVGDFGDFGDGDGGSDGDGDA